MTEVVIGVCIGIILDVVWKNFVKRMDRGMVSMSEFYMLD